MSGTESSDAELLRRAGLGDRDAVNQLFAVHRDRLRGIVQFRLNRKLRGRVDPSDVLQDAYLDTCQHLDEYLREPRLPFFLWLRHITQLKLLAVHRQHLGTQMRDAGLEAAPEVAAALVGDETSPSAATMRAEAQAIVQDALAEMEPVDREVLVLRHFEMLTNEETAQVLGLSKTAASNRYVRALQRLRQALSGFADLFAIQD